MKKRGFTSVYIKFVVVFVGILWICSTAAFHLISTAITDDIRNYFTEQIQIKAQYITDFCTKHSFDPEELQSLFSDGSIEVSVFESIQELRANKRMNTFFSQEQIQQLNSSEKMEGKFARQIGLPFISFHLGGKIVVIMPNVQNNALVLFKNVIMTVLLTCAGLGSVLIAIAARMIVKPIQTLTAAAKEVAKGNFDIQIRTRSRDEIGQLSDNFNMMTQELKNIEYLRKDFISSVSHEFKTPITSIQGFARLIKNKKLPLEQFDEYTDIIISETGRLANLSSNLLKLADLENQATPEHNVTFSIDEQIRNVILLLEDKWSAKRIDFDLDLHVIKYCGDEELLQQVWINLISNAIKFSHEGGEIRITAKKEGNVIKVVIADNGIGIADENKDRIFEKFYKGDTSRTKEGSGLGLPIVKKIIERCGGRISFESTLGKGSTFYVELVNK